MAAACKFMGCSWTVKTIFGLGQETRAFTAFMAAKWIVLTALTAFPASRYCGFMRIAKATCGLQRPRVLIVSVTFESLHFQPAKDWSRLRWILFSPQRMAPFGWETLKLWTLFVRAKCLLFKRGKACQGIKSRRCSKITRAGYTQ